MRVIWAVRLTARMSRCTGALGRRNIYGTVLAYTQQSLSIKGGGQSALRQEHASINPEVLHEPDTAVQQAAHETRLPALRIASLALTDAAPRAVARLFPPYDVHWFRKQPIFRISERRGPLFRVVS